MWIFVSLEWFVDLRHKKTRFFFKSKWGENGNFFYPPPPKARKNFFSGIKILQMSRLTHKKLFFWLKLLLALVRYTLYVYRLKGWLFWQKCVFWENKSDLSIKNGQIWIKKSFWMYEHFRDDIWCKNNTSGHYRLK